MASEKQRNGEAFESLGDEVLSHNRMETEESVDTRSEGRQTDKRTSDTSSVPPAGEFSRTTASKRMAAAMLDGTAIKSPAGDQPFLSSYRIPKLPRTATQKGPEPSIAGFTDEEESSNESDQEWPDFDTQSEVSGYTASASSKRHGSASGGRKAIQLLDPTMYDPLAEVEQSALPAAEAAFVEKYFIDPNFQPQILEKIAEGAPAPELIMNEVRRNIDPEILDMVHGKGTSQVKDMDKTYLSIDTRLGTALGPLLKAWTTLRQQRDRGSNPVATSICHDIEQSIVALGQAHNAVLFGRRKAVLASFFKDSKRAGDLVKRNQHAFGTNKEVLFGRVFHEALYKKAKHTKHLKEVKKELSLGGARKPGKPRFQEKQGQSQHHRHQGQQRKPFRGGPSSRGKGGGRGGAATSTSRYVQHLASNSGPKPNAVSGTICSHRGRTSAVRTSSAYSRWHSRRCDHATKLARTAAWARRRTVGPPFIQLAESNIRRLGAPNRQGSPHTMGVNSHTHLQRAPTSSGASRLSGTERRSRQIARERSNRAGGPTGSTICGIYVHSSKKGRGSETHFQSKAAQCLRNLPTLQDGRLAHGSGSHPTKRLPSQNRPEGRLLDGPNAPLGAPFPTFPVGNKFVSISGVSIRPGISTLDVHQTDETSRQPLTECCYKDGDLPRRYVAHAQQPDRADRSLAHDSVVARTPRFCVKLGQVSLIADPQLRVSRVQSEFSDHGNQLDIDQSRSDSAAMPRITSDVRDIGPPLVKSDWPLSCGSACSPSRTSVHAPSANAEDKGVTPPSPELREHRNSLAGMQSRAPMVDRRIDNLEREVVRTSQPGSSGGTDHGCLVDRLGSGMSGTDHTRSMVHRGENVAHQCARDESGSVRYESLPPGQTELSCACQGGQYHNSGQHQQDGQPAVSNDAAGDERAMAILSVALDHDYCGAPARSNECPGGHSVTTLYGQEQLAIKPPDVQTVNENVGPLPGRSVCGQGECPTSPVLQLETRSGSEGHRRFLSDLEDPQVGVCLPTVLSAGSLPCESATGLGRDGPHCAGLARPTVVCQTPSDDLCETNPVAPGPDNFIGPEPGAPPTNGGPEAATGGLAHFRERWEMQGFSAGAVAVMQQARRKGTQSAYDSAWQKWVGWCSERDTHPFRAPMAALVNFLSSRLQDGLEYSTLNVYRSALSLYHPKVDGYKIGQHPTVKEFMAGAFNVRPPKPRYQHTWDVNKVLDHIRSMGENVHLSIKDLTHKLAMLLAITNVSRAHELQRLNPQLMRDHGHYIVWHIDKLTKVKRPSRPEVKLTLHEFPESTVDVIACLRTYVTRTAFWRTSLNKQEQLFLAIVRPHMPVSTSTISRWLKELMAAAGIDVSVFKGHSVRAAACSKAADLGLSVPQIIERANWSSARTFHRFYHRDVLPEDGFQSAILAPKR